MQTWEKMLYPMVGVGNDWTYFEQEVAQRFEGLRSKQYTLPVSIIIPVYNRFEKLGKTIAALTHSTYPLDLIEIIIADDGSSDHPDNLVDMFKSYFSIKYVRQADKGFRASKIRNKGMKAASNESIIFIDCDMLPEPTLVEAFMKYLHVSSKLILLGGRRYVNTDEFSIQDVINDIQPILELPSQCADTGRGPVADEPPTEDWRYKIYRTTDNLKSAKYPFNTYCAGNIGLKKSLYNQVGGFDESFVNWGMEDTEIGYRLFQAGAWFIPVEDAKALHQEPPNGSNETNRDLGRNISEKQFVEKCPAKYRIYEENRTYEVPKVSVYIPAYNCSEFIVEAIESVLTQTYTDFEIVICNDGSTDSTGELLTNRYGSNKQIRILLQENKGISAATNAAINACRGEYILQLDSDDVLLPQCIEMLVKVLDTTDYGFVYGDSYLIDSENNDLGSAYSFSMYSRLRLLNGMFIHHPRMFRRREFSRTNGFEEDISNAVDYEFYLSLSQFATGYHLQTPLYLYRQHTTNTSKVNKGKQDDNTNIALESAFEKMGLAHLVELIPMTNDPRKMVKKLKVSTDELRINFGAIHARLGMINALSAYHFHYEIPRFISQYSQQVFNRELLEYANLGTPLIRVGPFGSSSVAFSVKRRLEKEMKFDIELQSSLQKNYAQHFVILSNISNDGIAVRVRRQIQDDFSWPAEIIRFQEGKHIIRNKSMLDTYLQYLNKDNQEIEKAERDPIIAYDIEQFWKVDSGRLIFTWNEEEVFFEMPRNWKFEETHSDLFQLAHYVMVEPWDKTVLKNWTPSRKTGWRPGLAFSGGVDSTAALALMPSNTVLLYNERTDISGQLDHTNAIRFFDEFEKKTNRPVIRIRSNHERLRQLKGKSAGFSTDYACAVQCIILADHFGLDSIATGMPLENSYLFHGYRYRDFNKSRFWNNYSDIFESVGLPLYQPVAGCSEIINMKISEQEGWSGWAQACLRSSKEGIGCGKCWKCFRKNTMMGLPFSMSNEISTFLSKPTLKQAASTLYSIQQNGTSSEGIIIAKEFPHLKPFLAMDLDFLQFHHESAMELIPEKYRGFTEKKLEQYALPMTNSALAKLKSFDLYSDNE